MEGRLVVALFQLPPIGISISHCGSKSPAATRILWAYNRDHLDFLEDYVQATLREGLPEQAPAVFKNKTAASRLPKWIKRAKN